MAAIYYIDSENVGDSWTELWKNNIDSDNQFLVFYTGHSPRIAYPDVIRLMDAERKPEFVECHEGRNALDFQLVTKLGFDLHSDSTKEMIIVSNDTGFDVVVNFWQEREMNVSRLSLANHLNSKTKKNDEPVSGESVVTSTSSCEVTKNIHGIDLKELCTVIYCIGINDKTNIHNAFVGLYGKNGKNIYKEVMKEISGISSPMMQKKERMEGLIQIIIRRSNIAKNSYPHTFVDFISEKVVANKTEMYSLLYKEYGDLGLQIYKAFRPFYKILVNIKNS